MTQARLEEIFNDNETLADIMSQTKSKEELEANPKNDIFVRALEIKGIDEVQRYDSPLGMSRGEAKQCIIKSGHECGYLMNLIDQIYNGLEDEKEVLKEVVTKLDTKNTDLRRELYMIVEK